MTLLIRQSFPATLHQAITERNAKILYRGTGVESYNDPRAMGLVEVAPLLPDAGSQWTLRWREPDSNHRSRSCERLFTPIGDGDTKGGATYRFRSETAMLAWSGCPQPFPSWRDREFESVFLQWRVGSQLDLRDPRIEGHYTRIIGNALNLGCGELAPAGEALRRPDLPNCLHPARSRRGTATDGELPSDRRFGRG